MEGGEEVGTGLLCKMKKISLFSFLKNKIKNRKNHFSNIGDVGSVIGQIPQYLKYNST